MASTASSATTRLAYLVDRVEGLDRGHPPVGLERFSAGRMTDGYEAIYRQMLGEAGGEMATAGATGDRGAPRTLQSVNDDRRSAGLAS